MAIGGECDIGGGGAVALLIGDDFGLSGAKDAGTGVGGSEIDADDSPILAVAAGNNRGGRNEQQQEWAEDGKETGKDCHEHCGGAT